MAHRTRPAAAFVLVAMIAPAALGVAQTAVRVGGNIVPAPKIENVSAAYSGEAQAARESHPAILVVATTARDGTRYQYEIPAERADALPSWNQAAASEPPLSMNEARRAAEVWLTARMPEAKMFELVTASLVKVSSKVQTGPCVAVSCWYYRLAFDPVVSGRRVPGDGQFTVVVLLDGSIVEPRAEKPLATAQGGGASGLRGPGGGTGGNGPQPSSAPSSTSQSGPGAYRAPGDVTAPVALNNPRPRYTPEAMRARIQGAVVVACVVQTNGRCTDVRITRSLDPKFGLDQEAVRAAKQFRFKPGERSGEPVPVLVTIELSFTLHD